MVTLKEFYDEHPINQGEILEKVQKAGKSLDSLAPEDLTPFDQDHYGATEATDELVKALGINGESRVLDLCSGVGGTSRYLAYRYGAEVLGVDGNAVRVEGARKLTELVGLADRVSYVLGDALELGEYEGSFDAIVSQESFLHIGDRERLLAGCLAALRSGGGLGFTDVTVTDKMQPEARRRFDDGLAASNMVSNQEYVRLLEAAGFRRVRSQDLSEQWVEILHARLEMYRSLESETVARYGRERFETYVGNYEFFISQIDLGALGGGRFFGWRA